MADQKDDDDQVNPPVAGEAEEVRHQVDQLDERVFAGADEEQRQEHERPAALAEAPAPVDGPDEDPMAGEAPSS